MRHEIASSQEIVIAPHELAERPEMYDLEEKLSTFPYPWGEIYQLMEGLKGTRKYSAAETAPSYPELSVYQIREIHTKVSTGLKEDTYQLERINAIRQKIIDYGTASSTYPNPTWSTPILYRFGFTDGQYHTVDETARAFKCRRQDVLRFQDLVLTYLEDHPPSKTPKDNERFKAIRTEIFTHLDRWEKLNEQQQTVLSYLFNLRDEGFHVIREAGEFFGVSDRYIDKVEARALAILRDEAKPTRKLNSLKASREQKEMRDIKQEILSYRNRWILLSDEDQKILLIRFGLQSSGKFHSLNDVCKMLKSKLTNTHYREKQALAILRGEAFPTVCPEHAAPCLDPCNYTGSERQYAETRLEIFSLCLRWTDLSELEQSILIYRFNLNYNLEDDSRFHTQKETVRYMGYDLRTINDQENQAMTKLRGEHHDNAQTIAQEFNQLIQIVLDNKFPREAEILRRHYGDGHTYQSIANDEGVTPQRIQLLVEQALGRIRKYLRKNNLHHLECYQWLLPKTSWH